MPEKIEIKSSKIEPKLGIDIQLLATLNSDAVCSIACRLSNFPAASKDQTTNKRQS
jgi:hypothetical protein